MGPSDENLIALPNWEREGGGGGEGSRNGLADSSKNNLEGNEGEPWVIFIKPTIIMSFE